MTVVSRTAPILAALLALALAGGAAAQSRTADPDGRLGVVPRQDAPLDPPGAEIAPVPEPDPGLDTGPGTAPPELEILAAEDLEIDDFRWQARLVVVFADSPSDPAFSEQLDLLAERPLDLIERDVVVIADADPEAASPVRRRLRPRGFSVVLLDKDGRVNLRKPFPWSVREIGRSIDKMPLRQQEIRERRARPERPAPATPAPASAAPALR